jgi:hypothetical protein
MRILHCSFLSFLGWRLNTRSWLPACLCLCCCCVCVLFAVAVCCICVCVHSRYEDVQWALLCVLSCAQRCTYEDVRISIALIFLILRHCMLTIVSYVASQSQTVVSCVKQHHEVGFPEKALSLLYISCMYTFYRYRVWWFWRWTQWSVPGIGSNGIRAVSTPYDRFLFWTSHDWFRILPYNYSIDLDRISLLLMEGAMPVLATWLVLSRFRWLRLRCLPFANQPLPLSPL